MFFHFYLSRECLTILTKKTNWESKISFDNFEAGVLLFNGMVNLTLSHLPSIFLRIVRLARFYGNRDTGLYYIHRVASENSCLFNNLGKLFIMHYNCYIETLVGIGPGDLDLVDSLVEYGLLTCPNVNLLFYLIVILNQIVYIRVRFSCFTKQGVNS